MFWRFFGRFVFFLAAATLGAALLGAFWWNQTWQGRTYPGVRIEGIELGGLTEQEALQKLDSVREEFLASSVTLVLGEHTWQLTRGDLGFQFDPAENTRLALKVGRNGSTWQRAQETWQAFYSQADLPFGVTLDRDRAKSVLENLAGELCDPPQNAQLVVNNAYQVRIVDGKPGKALDLDASVNALERKVYPFNEIMELHVADQQPQVTTRDVESMKVTGLLTSYTTYFDTSNTNRTYNINVAADALDNNLIRPGDIFSFNRIVGPRSQEAGYKEALIIEQNKFTPGIGGGVCQVSSTLYNTILLAGLDVVERTNHSLPVAYVPLGRDATVVYGHFDFRFRNNTGGYLYMKTRVSGGALTIAILGNTDEKKKVELQTVVDSELDFKVVNQEDPSLYQGKTLVENEGVKGYKVRAYRVIDGVKALLSNDTYAPVDKIVHVGTMPLPVTPLPPGDQDKASPVSDDPQQPTAEAAAPTAAPGDSPRDAGGDTQDAGQAGPGR